MNDVPDLTDDEFDEACLRLAMGSDGSSPASVTAVRSDPDAGRHTDTQIDDRLLANRQGPRADAVRQLRDELVNAQQQVRATSTELEESRTELEESRAELHALRGRVAELTGTPERAPGGRRRAELDDLSGPSDRVRIHEVDEREAAFRDSVVAAESRATELAAALAKSETLALRVAGEADELRERLAQREDDLARRDVEVTEIHSVAEERVSGLRSQVLLLKEQAKRHQIDVAAVAEEIGLRDKEIRELRDEVARLRILAASDELETVKRRETRLLDALRDREKEIMELREDLIEREERHAMEVNAIVEQFMSVQ